MPTRNISVVLVAALIGFMCYQKAEHNRYARSIVEAMRLIDDEYVEKVDERDLFKWAMEGMLGGLDQYSQYFGPESFKQMEESLDQKFGGVGIVVEKTSAQDPLLVLSPVVGTPAHKGGIRAGDKVLEINGESTIGMTSGDAIKRMRGDPGTPVVLKVLHPDEMEPVSITLVRAEIPVESVLGDSRRADLTWDYRLTDHPEIAYLHVITFGKQTAVEIEKILSSGQFQAVILDLRGNAGGLLTSAVETCDLFIDAGRIVSTRGRGNTDRDIYDAAPNLVVPTSIPMAVLVNRFSASASEIVAACLQDHERAVVIGQRTWGKGTVQNLFELESGRSALKITTATYWRPSGRNIHRKKDASEDDHWGVSPTDGFEVPLSDDEYDQIIKSRQIRSRAQARGTDDTKPPETKPPETKPGDSSSNAPSEKPGGAATPVPEAPATIQDPQLQRAIEYLQQKMSGQGSENNPEVGSK